MWTRWTSIYIIVCFLPKPVKHKADPDEYD